MGGVDERMDGTDAMDACYGWCSMVWYGMVWCGKVWYENIINAING